MVDSDERRVIAKKIDGGDDAIWLITLSDMSMLLLACFVLLFSMSTPNDQKFNESMASVQKALDSAKHGGRGTKEREIEGLLDQGAVLRQVQAMQQRIFNDLQNATSKEGLSEQIGTSFEGGVVSMRVSADNLFAGNQTALSPEGRAILTRLKDIFIKYKDQRINIRCFADDLTAKNLQGRDAWEFTSLRAVSVLRYFMESGLEPQRLSATGLADLEPRFPNNTDANRQRNNRVEFVLERSFGK
ncbi:MAG: OmpA family protein [Desulfovibrionaceae bacterium]|nr:OmpA family protein [Desulfovibrionaceae bacterium]MBF0513871.1 OmpA family protein [Desulfovibrionaceae bacterium]